MDDFDSNTILECRNEWCEQFILIIKPYILEGFDDIFNEAVKLCKEQNQMDKYLITFQNMLTQIPKWSQALVETETKRICDKSKCSYLESILSAIHISQLKALSAVRAGQHAKKIDINIPQLSTFIHNIYINIAREFYKYPHIFVISTPNYRVNQIEIKKNKREIDIIIREGIIETLRKNMPIEQILKAYLDPTEEEEIMEKIEEVYVEPSKEKHEMNENKKIISMPLSEELTVESNISPELQQTNIINDKSEENFTPSSSVIKNSTNSLSFNDIDTIVSEDNNITTIDAPKTIERLNEISELRNSQRKTEEDMEDDGNNIKLMETPSDVSLDDLFDLSI